MAKKRTLRMMLLIILGLIVVMLTGLGIFLAILLERDSGQQPMQDTFETYTDVVQISDGKIRGYMYQDTDVEVYKGIPYAAPPVGDLRWKAPQDAESWEGVRDCVYWSASAMQEEQNAFMNYTREYIISNKTYSEDCLYLNIWTTTDAREGNADLPVIVYIHGGAYNSGGSSCEIYQGHNIAQKGAVFVSINYRLGIFGYYANSELLAEDASAGNYGMLDQLKALEWVQNNIAFFGGDPGNVTVMGQSAGGQAVQSLIVSPKSAGLFHRAVVVSSNAVFRESYTTSQERVVLGDAAAEGRSLAELRAMSAEDVLQIEWDNLGGCIDGICLTDTYVNTIMNGEALDVDLMIGMADNPETPLYSFQTDAWFYTDTISKNISSTENLMGGLNYQATLRQQAQSYDGKVYIYNFSHMMPYKHNLYGTTHTSDVPYFLNVFTDFRKEYWTQEDFLLGDVMSGYLVNFASTGDPNSAGLPEWNESTGSWDYMNLDTDCKMIQITDENIGLIQNHYDEKLNASEKRK